MKPFAAIASVIFGFVCLVHVVRLFMGWQVTVNGAQIPLWISAAGALITGCLSALLWREARGK